MSKTTQRRAVVAALSFALGAAGTLPALAANDGSADAAPASYIDSLGDTLYDLPFVSFLPGQELMADADAIVDEAGAIVDGTAGNGLPIAGDLPVAGDVVSELPVLGSGLPVVGDLPIVGDLVSMLPVVGGGHASIEGQGGLPVVGGLVSELPIVGGGGAGLLGGLLGGAGGLLGGGSFL